MSLVIFNLVQGHPAAHVLVTDAPKKTAQTNILKMVTTSRRRSTREIDMAVPYLHIAAYSCHFQETDVRISGAMIVGGTVGYERKRTSIFLIDQLEKIMTDV